MTKASSFILRLYFAVISAVTLFVLMFGAIDLLSIGLKTYVFTAADVPSYLENCSESSLFRAPDSDEVSEEEIFAKCESRNEATVANYGIEKAENAVRNLALIIVSLPLFILHFRIVYRDWKGDRNTKSKK